MPVALQWALYLSALVGWFGAMASIRNVWIYLRGESHLVQRLVYREDFRFVLRQLEHHHREISETTPLSDDELALLRSTVEAPLPELPESERRRIHGALYQDSLRGREYYVKKLALRTWRRIERMA
jgi:hypothetical protein